MRAYKDSGIEWLGEIPEHWEVVKINKIVTFINGYAFENFDFNSIFEIPVIRIGDIQKEKILYDNCLKTKEKEKLKHFLIRSNDILIALSGATTGKIAFCDTDDKAYINQRVAIIRSKLKLVKYYFLTRGFLLLIELACNGSAQPNISTKEIGEFKIPLPPIEEQKAIADFLDSKCKLIETFIEKKQKLITLLNEKKQALINECVTKGLNKNIKYKNSGVEHLGAIPTHWEVRRLATFGKFSKGGNISRQDLVENGEQALLYGDIYMNYEISTSFLDSQISTNTSPSATPIYRGDILFAGSGETKEDIGKNIVYLGEDKAFAGGDIIIFRQKENNALFLSYALNTKYAKFYKGIESKGEIIVHIYASNLKDIKIPLPPIEEQKQIAEFLDSEISKIDSIIEKIKKQIELIKEYKNSLISQAVCGRIGVQ